jgi:hypothetical protein
MSDVLEYKLNLIDDFGILTDSSEYYTEWKYWTSDRYGWIFFVPELINNYILEIWFEVEILDYFDIFTPDGNIFKYSCNICGDHLSSEINEFLLQIIGKERYHPTDECNIIKIQIMLPYLYLNLRKSILSIYENYITFNLHSNVSESLGKGRFLIKYGKIFDRIYDYPNKISFEDSFHYQGLGMKSNEMEYIGLGKLNKNGEMKFCGDLFRDCIISIISFSEHFYLDRIECTSSGEVTVFNCEDEDDNIFYIKKNKWDGSMMIIIPPPNGIVKNLKDFEYLIGNKFQVSKINNNGSGIDPINSLKIFKNKFLNFVELKFYYMNEKQNPNCEYKMFKFWLNPCDFNHDKI